MRLFTSKPFCAYSSKPTPLPYLRLRCAGALWQHRIGRKLGHNASMQQCAFLTAAAAVLLARWGRPRRRVKRGWGFSAAFSLQGAVALAWCLSSCSGLRDADPARLAAVTFASSSCYVCNPQLGFCLIVVVVSRLHFLISRLCLLLAVCQILCLCAFVPSAAGIHYS